MSERDQAYVELLRMGFLMLQRATDEGNLGWVQAETEFLHNIPSLIGEPNEARHRYFWDSERAAYLQWIDKHGGPELASRVKTFYEPMLQLLASANRPKPVAPPLADIGKESQSETAS